MKPFILSAYFLVFFVQTVFASETTFIAVDDANPPFMFQENGKAGGLYPALLQAIFSRMEVQAEIKAYPWKRALNIGEKGEVAIGGIYKTEERSKIGGNAENGDARFCFSEFLPLVAVNLPQVQRRWS